MAEWARCNPGEGRAERRAQRSRYIADFMGMSPAAREAALREVCPEACAGADFSGHSSAWDLHSTPWQQELGSASTPVHERHLWNYMG
eukprot:7341903-Alexandrium_andersonii.AAC.1